MDSQFTEEIADRFIRALIRAVERQYDVKIRYKLKEKGK